MEKKKSRLELARDNAQLAIDQTNQRIEELGSHTGALYEGLIRIQEQFDKIRNVPSEKMLEYEKLKKIRLNWKQQVEKIEQDYQNAKIKAAGGGLSGASAGVAVVSMGPTAAMGIATTFGVASTGTAISTLSGAAATNAALAWLGGGALAVGGGGIAAGNALLALAGPVGWSIAGVAIATSGLFLLKNKSEKTQLENIFTLISVRDKKTYKLAIVELNERIERISHETRLLKDAIRKIQTFGLDYHKMSESQQYELGAYVNLMYSSTQLLTSPILGLQPKYNEKDFKKLTSGKDKIISDEICIKNKRMIIYLANLLYGIPLDEKDKTLLWKYMRNNKKLLEQMGVTKRDFREEVMMCLMDGFE